MAERLRTVNEVRDYYAGCNDALKEKVVEQRQTIGWLQRQKPIDQNAVKHLAAVQTEQLRRQAMRDRNRYSQELKKMKDEMAKMKVSCRCGVGNSGEVANGGGQQNKGRKKRSK